MRVALLTGNMRSTVAGISLLTAAIAAAQVEADVHLYDRAKLSQPLLEKAAATAERVFARAGIRTRWHVCDPACAEDKGGPVFVIGIAGPNLEIPAKAALGFAMLSAGNGNRAVVSASRIEDFAASTSTPSAIVLGHAIAHELGHLLARSNRHSSGVMAASWGNAGAARMRQGNLYFAKGDVDAMHKDLKARNR